MYHVCFFPYTSALYIRPLHETFRCSEVSLFIRTRQQSVRVVQQSTEDVITGFDRAYHVGKIRDLVSAAKPSGSLVSVTANSIGRDSEEWGPGAEDLVNQ